MACSPCSPIPEIPEANASVSLMAVYICCPIYIYCLGDQVQNEQFCFSHKLEILSKANSTNSLLQYLIAVK